MDIDRHVGDVFELRVIDDETMRLALEAWEIWLRWEEAFHSGRTPHETHPALPADRERHAELRARLDPRLAAIRACPPDVRAHADFEHVDGVLRARWQKLAKSE